MGTFPLSNGNDGSWPNEFGPSTPVRAFHQPGESPCPGIPQPGIRRKLRHREMGWGVTGCELSVCSKANLFRRDVATSLLGHGEV